jgi:hypothetical protein
MGLNDRDYMRGERTRHTSARRSYRTGSASMLAKVGFALWLAWRALRNRFRR